MVALSNEIIRLAIIVVAAFAVVMAIEKFMGSPMEGMPVNGAMGAAMGTMAGQMMGQNQMSMEEELMNGGGMTLEDEMDMGAVPEAGEPISMMGSGVSGLKSRDILAGVIPTGELTADELLPKGDANLFSAAHPQGDGFLAERNFLTSGFHIGINSQSSTLKNASLDLRSEPPNPRVQVSPWLQTSILPDSNRKQFNIGI